MQCCSLDLWAISSPIDFHNGEDHVSDYELRMVWLAFTQMSNLHKHPKRNVGDTNNRELIHYRSCRIPHLSWRTFPLMWLQTWHCIFGESVRVRVFLSNPSSCPSLLPAIWFWIPSWTMRSYGLLDSSRHGKDSLRNIQEYHKRGNILVQ